MINTNARNAGDGLENVVIIRGGGDLASGTIHRLYRSGYRLLVLECEKPTAIRRMVSFCEAVYDGQSSVEGVLCRKINSIQECDAAWMRERYLLWLIQREKFFRNTDRLH